MRIFRRKKKNTQTLQVIFTQTNINRASLYEEKKMAFFICFFDTSTFLFNHFVNKIKITVESI